MSSITSMSDNLSERLTIKYVHAEKLENKQDTKVPEKLFVENVTILLNKLLLLIIAN